MTCSKLNQSGMTSDFGALIDVEAVFARANGDDDAHNSRDAQKTMIMCVDDARTTCNRLQQSVMKCFASEQR